VLKKLQYWWLHTNIMYGHYYKHGYQCVHNLRKAGTPDDILIEHTVRHELSHENHLKIFGEGMRKALEGK
jgi:hypothetical protein